MPKVPVFRPWFEREFGDLCEQHDREYGVITTYQAKVESDYRFARAIADRGYVWLSILALAAVSLPFVRRDLK